MLYMVCIRLHNTSDYTRITNETATLVDHMATNCLDKISSSGVIHNGVSDHSMSYLVWKSNHIVLNSNYVTFRKCKGIDMQLFLASLQSQNWSEIENCETIDQALAKWEELLLEVVNKYMPVKTKRVRKKQSPWLNETIFKLIKERDKMKERAKMKKSQVYWKEYKRLKNKVTLEIRKNKKKYYLEQLSQCKDRNQSWKILKTVIPNKKSKSNFAHDPEEKAKLAREFNTHFANVAEDLRKRYNFDCVSSKDTTGHLKRNSSPHQKFVFSCVTEDEVLKLINSLKNTKSVGVDDISSFILKASAPAIVKSLTYIINKSLLEGTFPKRWKTAKIVPVFKKGDKTQADNYRPISLLSCVSKVLEKVVQKQLILYLRTYCILAKEQSGFRLKHSTYTALIKVTDDWIRAIDRGEYVGSIFVDLQKAFDMVDHETLLKKLEDIGITELSLEWFRSYLTDRKIITCINNIPSKELPLKHGVPQGSLLGPLLFLIFINDLPSCFNKCSVHLYADDTVIFYADKNVSNIQKVLNEELRSLDIWMRCNKLKVNCSKTVSMLMGTKRMLTRNNTLNVSLNGEKLLQVKNFKYLGMYVDDELKWNLHIQQLCEKVGRMINYLARIKHFLNTSALKMIYNTVILPHFDYADVVWQSATKTQLEFLQKLQNRAARIILNVNPYEHKSTLELHHILDWEYLGKRRLKHTMSFMYKILHNMAPEYMEEEFASKFS